MWRLALVVLLASCAHEERIEGSGVEAEPPSGWVDYCFRHPADEDCTKTELKRT